VNSFPCYLFLLHVWKLIFDPVQAQSSLLILSFPEPLPPSTPSESWYCRLMVLLSGSKRFSSSWKLDGSLPGRGSFSGNVRLFSSESPIMRSIADQNYNSHFADLPHSPVGSDASYVHEVTFIPPFLFFLRVAHLFVYKFFFTVICIYLLSPSAINPFPRLLWRFPHETVGMVF